MERGLENVHQSIKQIREQSPIIAEMEDKGEITEAFYDVNTGLVSFFKK